MFFFFSIRLSGVTGNIQENIYILNKRTLVVIVFCDLTLKQNFAGSETGSWTCIIWHFVIFIDMFCHHIKWFFVLWCLEIPWRPSQSDKSDDYIWQNNLSWSGWTSLLDLDEFWHFSAWTN